jgi:dipeptidyl-peptidase 4
MAQIPVEAIADFPAPGMNVPGAFSFSQDDTTLTYLWIESPENPTQQLYVLNVETGERQILVQPPGEGLTEDNLSLEEELRRQRARMLTTGITRYQRAPNDDNLLIPIGETLYIYDGDLRELVTGSVQTPKFSPDGAWVAYVQDDEISVIPVAGGDPRQVTVGARGTGKTNGLAEFIAQEELYRNDGFWWSPDSTLIAYTEVDETHIPVYRIPHQGKDEPVHEDHRYPFAGKDNAVVRLLITPREGGEAVEMDLNYTEEIYLGRVFWWASGKLGAHVLNRKQNRLELVAFDPATGERETIHTETSDYWISLRTRYFYQLSDGGFIWASERSGYNHLYYYNAAGALVAGLTEGSWMVDDIVGVDEANQQVYFTANRAGPTEKQLYRVGLTGDEVHPITRAAGTHHIKMSRDCTLFVDVFSALDRPPAVSLRRVAGDEPVHTITEPNDARLSAYDLPAPEIVTLESDDGDTLYGAVYRPPPSFGDGPFPVVVYVYGGPGPQLVTNDWKLTADVRSQVLRQKGFVVFRLDNRGSARRGTAFEGALKHRMGTVEVADQIAGVKWLVTQGLADPARVGIYGWSYGGYMALMCLAKAPDVFQVAVSGAPVTHWDGYDTAYTERYMDTPQANPAGYDQGSVMNHIKRLQGDLLIIHGMLDENVHFRHTARLINALNRARKRYDLLIFPDERHMPRRREDRVYLNQRIVDYFTDHL